MLLFVDFALRVQFIGSDKVVFKFEEAPKEKTAKSVTWSFKRFRQPN